jgi:hypothetical protein
MPTSAPTKSWRLQYRRRHAFVVYGPLTETPNERVMSLRVSAFAVISLGVVFIGTALVAPGPVFGRVAQVGLARRSAPTITCWGKETAADDYRIVYIQRLVERHPAICSLGGPYVDEAHNAELRDLKWRSWGDTTATASGGSVELGALSPGETRKTLTATVVASVIRTSGGRSWYSRLSVTTSIGTQHFQLSPPTARDYQIFG